MLYRHGDVLVEKVRSLPAEASKQRHTILAEGEVTGHCHRIEEPNAACLYKAGNELFLEVTAKSATLVHEEHAAIELPSGVYRVWRQREYSPQAIRIVRD